MGFTSKICPPLWLSPLEFFKINWKGYATKKQLPFFKNRKYVFTQSCRTAIYHMREVFALSEGDEVLISAYNCGTEVDALISSGLKVKFVDADKKGFVNLDAIKRAASDKTKVLYIIHPFGWVQPCEEIDKWRKTNGILLFEDCALSLLSKDQNGEPVGTNGDAAAFSFHKSVAVPEAGALLWQTDWEKQSFSTAPHMLKTVRQLASLGKNWARRVIFSKMGKASNSRIKRLSNGIEELPNKYYFEDWRKNKTCSSIAKTLLLGTNWDEVVEKRRENYLSIVQYLKTAGFEPLYQNLPNGVVPLHCPLLVQNRDQVVDMLAERGIVSTCWWSAGHRDIEWAKFPNAKMLKQNLLPLPVHHKLNSRDMEYIVETLQSLHPS